VTVIRHVVAHGLVQGVGYRAFVERRAHEHDIEGWVRNRRDGSVEAVFSGSEEAVAAVIGACRRGPRHAQVERVDVEEGKADLLAARPSGERFSVLPTV
jgi:acylphosphatase